MEFKKHCRSRAVTNGSLLWLGGWGPIFLQPNITETPENNSKDSLGGL